MLSAPFERRCGVGHLLIGGEPGECSCRCSPARR